LEHDHSWIELPVHERQSGLYLYGPASDGERSQKHKHYTFERLHLPQRRQRQKDRRQNRDLLQWLLHDRHSAGKDGCHWLERELRIDQQLYVLGERLEQGLQHGDDLFSHLARRHCRGSRAQHLDGLRE
jgi:hypothetical protein